MLRWECGPSRFRTAPCASVFFLLDVDHRARLLLDGTRTDRSSVLRGDVRGVTLITWSAWRLHAPRGAVPSYSVRPRLVVVLCKENLGQVRCCCFCCWPRFPEVLDLASPGRIPVPHLGVCPVGGFGIWPSIYCCSSSASITAGRIAFASRSCSSDGLYLSKKSTSCCYVASNIVVTLKWMHFFLLLSSISPAA